MQVIWCIARLGRSNSLLRSQKLSESRCFNCSIIELEENRISFWNWCSDAQRI